MINPILKQDLIEDAEQATYKKIKSFIVSLGFKQTTEESYVNEKYLVFDLFPRNVLIDKNGVIYVIDAEIKSIEELKNA